MTEFLAVVPSRGIENTGEFSWKFLIEADVSCDVLDRPFGFLGRRRKEPNDVDPFKFARGEPDAIGDDGVLRWNVCLFQAPKGFILGACVDSLEGEPALPRILRQMPDCNLLVPDADIDPFSQVCSGVGYQLEIHRYEGALTTS